MKNTGTLIYILIIQTLLLSIPATAADIIIGQKHRGNNASQQYAADLREYASYTHVISGGFKSGNKVFIKIGNKVFYENIPNETNTAGVYVVAILKNRVLLHNFYNTFSAKGASSAMARDIAKLPDGTFIVIAAKDEPTRHFDKAGQKLLHAIGADIGLLNQTSRTSYFCIGIKDLEKEMAIEQIGIKLLEHKGENADKRIDFIFKKTKEAKISSKPGKHKGLMIDQTEVLYYIPKTFDPKTAQYLFLIHETMNLRSRNALNMISRFERLSNAQNLVLIAPVFSCTYSRKVSQRDFKESGTLKNPSLFKNHYLLEYSFLINRFNEHRSDTILIKTFGLFNNKLMKRKTFSIYGHFAGADFLQRFVMHHPELIDKAAWAFINSYTFPVDNKDYPYGLKTNSLTKTFGNQIRNNDTSFLNKQLDKKLNMMLDVNLHIISDKNDGWLDRNEKTKWQGRSRAEKANNFYKELQKTDKRLKKAGIRDKTKTINTKIHSIPNLKRDPNLAAKEAAKLLF